MIRFPEVNKCPIEPYFALLFLILGPLAAREQTGRRGVHEHHRLGSNRLETVVFPHTRHVTHQGIHRQPTYDGVSS